MYNQDYLCHYGRLGMKWGRRKIQRKTQEIEVYRNRTLSDAGAMRDRAKMNLTSAINNKVDKKIINSAKDAHTALAKSYEAIKNLKISEITSEKAYQNARLLIDNVAAKPVIEFEKKYGADQAFNLIWS